MDKVAVITDSVACLPQELIGKYGIKIVPLNIIIDNRTYRDGVDLAPAEFYQLLRKAKKLPTTSPPSPGDYLEAYSESSRRSSAILCITVSAKFTALVDSARLAKEAAKESIPEISIEVFDSGSAAGAEGFVVLAAAEAAARGAPLPKVAQAAQLMKSKVSLIAMLDTLHYLHKSGRVPMAAAWASSLLQIKPIFQLSAEEVTPLARARTRHKAMLKMLEIMQRRTGGKPVHINLMHADAPEEAERLKEKLLAGVNCVELFITEFTPVMGCHTGPGVLALAFYVEGEVDVG